MNRKAPGLFAALVVVPFCLSVSSRSATDHAQAPMTAMANASASPKIGRPGAIARIWRGRTLASKAADYQAYLNASGIDGIRTAPGNLGVTVLRRTENGRTEFLVISIWESIKAVEKFAGKDYQKAVVLPRDREYLLEVEPNVLHYEIIRDERKP
jgi:heme-degrading monooxygenase HmoA